MNLTGISEGLMSLAVDSMTPPKRPPPFLPRPPPIISADLLIMNNRNPLNHHKFSLTMTKILVFCLPMMISVGSIPVKLAASSSDLYTTGMKFGGSMLMSICAFSRFLSNESTLPILNHRPPCWNLNFK